MPRKNQLPEREIAICKRVREFRVSLGISRVVFASKIGADSSELARVEHLRAPVRFRMAQGLFKAFALNQGWLATGTGSRTPLVEIPEGQIPSTLPKLIRFSEVFDKYMEQSVALTTRAYWDDPRREMGEFFVDGVGRTKLRNAKRLVGELAGLWLRKIHPDDWGFFLSELDGHVAPLLKQFRELPPNQFPNGSYLNLFSGTVVKNVALDKGGQCSDSAEQLPKK